VGVEGRGGVAVGEGAVTANVGRGGGKAQPVITAAAAAAAAACSAAAAAAAAAAQQQQQQQQEALGLRARKHTRTYLLLGVEQALERRGDDGAGVHAQAGEHGQGGQGADVLLRALDLCAAAAR